MSEMNFKKKILKNLERKKFENLDITLGIFCLSKMSNQHGVKKTEELIKLFCLERLTS